MPALLVTFLLLIDYIGQTRFLDKGPFVEEKEKGIEEMEHMRNNHEVRVNRKMEPIERLAATSLDQEASNSRKRLVPMVILIAILRIALVSSSFH